MNALKRLPWMILGYGAAVMVATLVSVALVLATSALSNSGISGANFKMLSDVLSIAYVGAIVTTIYAFPGWLISVCVAAWRLETRQGYFAVTGGLTAALAHLLLSGFASGSGPMLGLTGEMGGIILWSIIGGLVGGLAYWRVAMVRFGGWRVTQ